ncbi:MAG TPA: hypothetical protein VF469_38300 [Kofleriaceae bacterium]
MASESTTSQWAREYLVKPHHELGRAGPVCPYVHGSMDRGSFFLGVCPGDPDHSAVHSLLMRYRDWFLELDPRPPSSAQLKTILITFPDLPPDRVPEVIDATQRQLKPHYVSQGLMIGEFHPGPPDKGGLWNKDFRPLWCPVPVLAIRNLVPTDFPFLAEESRFVQTYLMRIGDAVPEHLRQAVAEARLKYGLTSDKT